MSGQVRGDRAGHLTVNASIQDLLDHPAFAGFGRLLLPWDDRTYGGSLRLRDIGTLLPYHSQVNPGDVVAALNRLIDDASKGKTIFYDFYAETQKPPPASEYTGLFFFRGTPGAPFAIIAPGGGFTYVGSVHEGFPYGAVISQQGYNAFVLRYRARGDGNARHSGHGGRHLVHLQECGKARSQHRRLLPVGKLGRRKNGGGDRVARRGRPWRRRPAEAVRRGDGLYGSLRPCVP